MKSEYKVIWTRTAQDELLEIGKYIARDSVKIALQKMELIEEKVSNLEYFPNEGRNIPELTEYEDNEYKELIVSPWRIIYKIELTLVTVVMVIDGRRNLQDILYKKLMK